MQTCSLLLKLNSVAQVMPNRLKELVAEADAVQSSTSVALFHDLILLVPHAVTALLLETKMTTMSPARCDFTVATKTLQ